MPYRVDITNPPSDALDLLVELGALDVEAAGEGIAAILPDAVTPDKAADVLGNSVVVSDAVARDNGSVWLLSPRAIRIGGLLVNPADVAPSSKVLRLMDSPAFGTGHHVTTALCVEALEEILTIERIESVLDVGTGSGILALASLKMGVPRAVGLDIDAGSLTVAAENARLNQMENRLELRLGEPGDVNGSWPLIVANLTAAPLIGMAPALVRLLRSRGRLILAGIQWSLEPDVRSAYQHFGIRNIRSRTRAGWTVLVGDASW